MMNERFRDERARLIARSDILEYNVRSFEDGFTRRSLKLAQRAFVPALACRGALRDLASQTDN